jgi:putative cell wall-binding protein
MIYAVVLGLMLGSGMAISPASAPTASAAEQEDKVLSRVNAERAANGLGPLTRDASIEAAAEEWAQHLSDSGTFVHSTSEWRSARIPAGWNSQGENIAKGYPNADSVMTGWMNSEGHRANILRGSYTRTGIGYVAAGNYWVQIFAGYSGDTAKPSVTSATPTITGNAALGQTLTARPGTWGPGAVTLTYQWNRNGVAVAGATGSTFNVGYLEAGTRLSVSVTGSKTGYNSATVSSAPTSEVVTDRSVERLDGPDRYAVAVSIASVAYPATAPVVYVASGENYPDALAAGPAAAKEGGPLLLTAKSSLPSSVNQTIRRLAPQKIVVVGGPNSVSDSVLDELRGIQQNVVRVTGNDRFEVSRKLAASVFADVAPSRVYVVTGNNFPDALSASAAAAAQGVPVILVDGSRTAVDAATVTTITDLGSTRVTIAGGPNSVSPGIESSLAKKWQTVRLSGADRYAASQAISRDAYPGTADRVILSTGLNYPDALAGSAWAGVVSAPLYVVPGTCVPQGTLAEIYRLDASTVTLLGGTASLTVEVQKLVACGF